MKRVDELLIDVANKLETAILIGDNKVVSAQLNSIQDEVLIKIKSPWRYDLDSDTYILCSQKEWEKREKKETAEQSSLANKMFGFGRTLDPHIIVG